jgi:hypothetical protein
MTRKSLIVWPGGKPYFRVAVGLSKTDATRMANRYRSFGNLARIRKFKSAAGTYRWDVYAFGRVGMGNVRMGY